jgi:hypothetical protein
MSARIQRLRVDNFKFKRVKFCEFFGKPQYALRLTIQIYTESHKDGTEVHKEKEIRL